MAMVFQSYALYPHMTVYENMAFSLQVRKVPAPEIEKKVREAAELLGIGDLLNRKPRQLSGGQRQRVAVCRAIVRDPEVFLFDEPLSNLDAKLRVQARGEIRKLPRRLDQGGQNRCHGPWEVSANGTAYRSLRKTEESVCGRISWEPFDELLRGPFREK